MANFSDLCNLCVMFVHSSFCRAMDKGDKVDVKALKRLKKEKMKAKEAKLLANLEQR